MFPVRYELNFYILFRRNSVFKWLIDYFFLFLFQTRCGEVRADKCKYQKYCCLLISFCEQLLRVLLYHASRSILPMIVLKDLLE
jgi:hypothetical protein